jgi:hypothetical protein
MLDTMLHEFARGMSGPGLFQYLELSQHIGKVRCDLSPQKLEAPNRLAASTAEKEGKAAPTYNGLTHSEYHIEVACDSDFRDADGKVLFYKTALLYELLNACLWKFEGYEVAYAECGLNPDEPFHWKWLKDIDGDGDVDAQDATALKEKRIAYDEAFKRVKAGLLSKFESEAS